MQWLALQCECAAEAQQHHLRTTNNNNPRQQQRWQPRSEREEIARQPVLDLTKSDLGFHESQAHRRHPQQQQWQWTWIGIVRRAAAIPSRDPSRDSGDVILPQRKGGVIEGWLRGDLGVI